ncbi:hypothetical protein B6D52_02520 [Candidatus Parcubacteria bacterium 4484_255]|nr:MAG: hypothetical protein B6D52_02520 [Candidatus Parcubacteria bacterium 4484_255]
MNKKTLIILLGIFIILGAASTYSWWGQYFNFNNKKPFSNSGLNFSTFTKKTTEKIYITKSGEEEKIIEKKSGVWKVNGFDASQEEIDDFFVVLPGLVVESLVSKNPKNHKNFGVAEENGIHLALTQNGAETTFIIGNSAATFNSFYIKIKGSNNVYKMSGMLRYKLTMSVAAWRDKTIIRIPKQAIQKIEVVSNTKPLILAKNEGSWIAERLGKTSHLDETTLNSLFSSINPLKASGFLNEQEQKEFQDASKQTAIRIFGNNQAIIAEITMLKKENEWWAAKVNEQDGFYKIPSYKLSNIFLTDEEIFEEK